MERTTRLFPHADDAAHYPWAWAVQDEQGVVLLGWLGHEEPHPGTPFLDYIDAQSCHGLWDTLYRADIFRLGGGLYGRQPEAEADFEALPFVDELLAPSRGVLLWDHQLDELFALADVEVSELADLRRGINRRDAAVFALAQQLEILPGLTVGQVIDDRMRFGMTVRAQLRTALGILRRARRQQR